MKRFTRTVVAVAGAALVVVPATSASAGDGSHDGHGGHGRSDGRESAGPREVRSHDSPGARRHSPGNR